MSVTRFACVAAFALSACAPPRTTVVQQSTDPLFTNGGFESGGLNGWTINTYLNNAGLAAVPPTSTAQLQLTTGGSDFSSALSNGTPQSQAPTSGAAPPTPMLMVQAGVPLWPRFGMTSVAINQDGAGTPAGQSNHQGANQNVNSLLQDTTPTLADVDPADGKVHVRYVFAPELEAAGHAPPQQPYVFVALRNKSRGNAELYTDFDYANQVGVPWSSQGTGVTSLLYTDWRIFDYVPRDDQFALGDTLETEIFAVACQLGAHSATAYVDGFGSMIPGLAISATAPTELNLDSSFTYGFTVENNTSSIVPNVVATEVLPPNTTFVSLNAPSSAQCTTPSVGQAGTVACTWSSLSPGASSTFSVTLHAYAPTTNGTGTSTASAVNTLTDATQAWIANQLVGYTVFITNSSNAGALGEQAVIATNTGTRLTIVGSWTTTPPVGSTYKIVAPPSVLGTATAGTASTLTDSTQSWTPNQWVGYSVEITSGTGASQQRVIGSNTATTLTTESSWATTPAASSVYVITNPVTDVINGNYRVSAPTVASLIGPKRVTKIDASMPFADLAITKTDGVPAVTWGGTTTYHVTVTNNGPSAVAAAPVTDTLPAQIASATWSCAAAGGSCGAPSGSGNINTTVSLPANASAIFTVTAQLATGSGTSTVTNTATVAAPAGVIDNDPSNNASTDQDQIAATLDLVNVAKDTSSGATGPGNGTGTITSMPAAISCGSACASQSASFADGSTVILYAVAQPSDVFLGWGGDCAAFGSALSCTLTMNAAKNVTAKFSACGNGVLDSGEGCDDGGNNGLAGDVCTVSCTRVTGQPCNATAPGLTGNASCASGICDMIGEPTPGVCAAAGVCGNGVLDPGEGCDDGGNNGLVGDMCTASCKRVTGQPCNATAPGATGAASCESGICATTGYPTPGVCMAAGICGNGVLDPGEGCDDGGSDGKTGDVCTAMCEIVSGQPCNATAPGATGNASCVSGICATTGYAPPGLCKPAGSCGNGVLEAGEGCDHGGNDGQVGDTCDTMCMIVNGGACNAMAPGFTGSMSCQSGLCSLHGGAPGQCVMSNFCGNGVLEAGEGCDDGASNGSAGDPCDSTCKVTSGHPCNTASPGVTGNLSCESGMCSANGSCEAMGSCNVDADCTGGAWCKESTNACTQPLANGVALPNDPPHVNPTLDGTCTTAAAALVCASGVCDTDGKCGYANGDGMCTASNAAQVCRSGMCTTATCGAPPMDASVVADLGVVADLSVVGSADLSIPASADLSISSGSDLASGGTPSKHHGCAVGGSTPGGDTWPVFALLAALAWHRRRRVKLGPA